MKTPHNSVDTVESYEAMHKRRWELTMEWLHQGVILSSQSRILEVSNQSPLALMMETKFGCPVDNTEFDVREPQEWEKLFSDYSLVVCAEVIEHLPDCKDEHGEFHMRGVTACLSGCFNVLLPGGWLMLTTPNASSLMVLDRWLRGEDPMNWIYHPREFGYKTTVDAVKNAGFIVVRAATENPYDNGRPQGLMDQREWLKKNLSVFSTSAESRGETTFVLARKGN